MASGFPPGPTCSLTFGGQASGYIDAGTSALTTMQRPGILGADALHVPTTSFLSDDTWRLHPFDAAQYIFKALQESRHMVGPIVLHDSGVALGRLIDGLIPGLFMAVGSLGASMVLGGMIGGAVGGLAAGIGAVPGAVLGGKMGFDLGMAGLSFLGLGFLVSELGHGLPRLRMYAESGIRRAVHAMNLPPMARPAEMHVAAKDLAQAQALLCKLILMGLVAWLLKRSALDSAEKVVGSAKAISGAAAAGTSTPIAQASVAELVAQLRTSQLSSGFADWVQANWQQLIENPKLRPQMTVRAASKPAAEVVTPSQLAKLRQQAEVAKKSAVPVEGVAGRAGDVGGRPPFVSERGVIGTVKPSNWGPLTAHPDGHALSVHGGGVTDAQLAARARTGVKPNGSTGPIPPLSSAFHSDELLIATDQIIREGGGLANAIARQQGQSVIRVETQDVGLLDMDLGYGYIRLRATGNKAANSAGFGPLQRIDRLNSAQGIYEFNPATKVWETITIYPVLY